MLRRTSAGMLGASLVLLCVGRLLRIMRVVWIVQDRVVQNSITEKPGKFLTLHQDSGIIGFAYLSKRLFERKLNEQTNSGDQYNVRGQNDR